jgi:hypothetical protein
MPADDTLEDGEHGARGRTLSRLRRHNGTAPPARVSFALLVFSKHSSALQGPLSALGGHRHQGGTERSAADVPRLRGSGRARRRHSAAGDPQRAPAFPAADSQDRDL